MKIESLIYIVIGIGFIIYRHYKQTQKAKQAGSVKGDVLKTEDQSYEQEPHDSSILSIENIFEEFKFEEAKPQKKFVKKEPVIDTISQAKLNVLPEEGVPTTQSQTEKSIIEPAEIVVKEELPKKSFSDILSKYKASKQNENQATPVFQNVLTNIHKKDFEFDARQAFIYSEIFKRKYEY